MPFKVIDKNSKTEDWRSIFAARTNPTLSRPWSWCPGSYAHERTDDGKCPHCKQIVAETWRGNREMVPHLVSPLEAGVYLIDVGETDRAPGPRCLKVGSSNNVLRRLQQHAHDPKHERCVVLHCLPCPPGWQVACAMEYLINDQLARRGAAGRSSGETWDYFEWDERHIDFCRMFMVPKLVKEIMQVVERFAERAGR